MTVLYLSVQFDHASFGQFSDLRFNLEIFLFFRGDLPVFDFFGNTHREAHSTKFGRPMKQSNAAIAVVSNAGSAVVSFSDFISTDLSRIPRTLRPGPACIWRVFMLELDSEMLVFTYGKYLLNQKLIWR